MSFKLKTVCIVGLSVAALAACGPKTTTAPTQSPPSPTSPSSSASSPSSAPTSSSANPTSTTSGADVSAVSTAVKNVTSMKFTMVGEMSSGQINMVGQMAVKPLAADLIMEMAGAKISERIVDGIIYIKTPASPKWIALDPTTAGSTAGLNVADLLKQVENATPTSNIEALTASKDLTEVGTETIRGEETTHYQGTVNVADSLNTFSAETKAQLEKLISSEGVTNVTMNVWVNAENLPVRLTETYASKSGPVKLQMDYLAYNIPVNVTAPPASEIMKLPTS